MEEGDAKEPESKRCCFSRDMGDDGHLCCKPGCVYRYIDAVNALMPLGGTGRFYCKESSWSKVEDLVKECTPEYSYNRETGVCTFQLKVEWELQ